MNNEKLRMKNNKIKKRPAKRDFYWEVWATGIDGEIKDMMLVRSNDKKSKFALEYEIGYAPYKTGLTLEKAEKIMKEFEAENEK